MTLREKFLRDAGLLPLYHLLVRREVGRMPHNFPGNNGGGKP